MALIKCLECGKNASSKLNICIHFRFQFNQTKKNTSEEVDVEFICYDLEEVLK